MNVPVFQCRVRGTWHFWGIDGVLSPGYATRERAEAKYAEYCDYTTNVPTCHHPMLMNDAFDVWMGVA